MEMRHIRDVKALIDVKVLTWASTMPAIGPDCVSCQSGCHAAARRGHRALVARADAQEIHDALADAGTAIVAEPFDGPFGRTFTFADPDGYQITLHSQG
jgi:hypothetical protein